MQLIPLKQVQIMNIIKKGSKRYFTGNTQIEKPINHGCSPSIYYALLEQAYFTIKEWNGKKWVDLKTKNLNALKDKNR